MAIEAERTEQADDRRSKYSGLVIGLCIGFTFFALLGIAVSDLSEAAVFLPFGITALLASFAAAWLLVLHPWLAALVPISLGAIFVWALGLTVYAGMPLTANTVSSALTVEAAGALLLMQALESLVADIRLGFSAEDAAARVSREARICALVLLAPIISVTALAISGMGPLGSMLIVAIGTAAGVLAMLFWVLPVAAANLRFDESFVMRINRAHERRERMLAGFAAIAQPRWAFSLLGISAVLFTIVLFRGGNSGERISFAPLFVDASIPALGAALAGWGMIGLLVARDWRAFAVSSIPPVVAGLAGAWLVTAYGFALPLQLSRILVLTGGIGAAAGALIVAEINAYRRFGDTVETAYARTLNEAGSALLASGLGLVLSMLLAGVFLPAMIGAAIVLLIEILGALFLLPALATVLATLLPRRRSLEEMYG